MTVPIVVSGDDGSPYRMAFTFGTSASRKSPLIAGCAITRCTEMQTWPALAKPPRATALDASSRSASGMITTGQDAPSSSDSFFTPARAAMRSPMPVEPVNDTFRTRGSATSSVAQRAARAGQHRQHALGQPGVDEARRQRQRGERGVAGGLEDDRVPRRQRRARSCAAPAATGS